MSEPSEWRPREWPAETVVVFPGWRGEPDRKHVIRYHLAYGDGVELGFPDGRFYKFSLPEWVALAVNALESAGYTQPIAKTFERRLIRRLVADIRRELTKTQARLDELEEQCKVADAHE